MINVFSKTDDFIQSEKIKAFALVCSKFLSSWTGLGRSGHVQITTFDSISHASGPKLFVWGDFIMVLHGFAPTNQKTMLFYLKIAIFVCRFGRKNELFI